VPGAVAVDVEAFLTRREAAERAGVSVATVDRAIAAGELRAGKVGRLVRARRSSSTEG
jgi:excisionase family DNA binding protein